MWRIYQKIEHSSVRMGKNRIKKGRGKTKPRAQTGRRSRWGWQGSLPLLDRVGRGRTKAGSLTSAEGKGPQCRRAEVWAALGERWLSYTELPLDFFKVSWQRSSALCCCGWLYECKVGLLRWRCGSSGVASCLPDLQQGTFSGEVDVSII